MKCGIDIRHGGMWSCNRPCCQKTSWRHLCCYECIYDEPSRKKCIYRCDMEGNHLRSPLEEKRHPELAKERKELKDGKNIC